MKKFARWALCLGLCLALSVCAALAEEAPTVAVQLDGQNLAFTDAVPQVKDQRTFLPFRAVFEAMGAQVDYEGSVITAARGDKVLTMTLNETTATVTEKGAATPITMDVAPYVDPATWRTYVPVRFAAQAFDCVVGWDQEAQTAIIIDTDKLLSGALEGKSFTYLEKLNAMTEKYNKGIWDVTATFDADMRVMTMPMTVSGTMTGTVQDSDKMSADMNMKLDMSQFLAGLSQMMGADNALSPEEQAMMDALKTDGVDLSMRGDMAVGKLYMNMDMGALAAQAEMDPKAWYELDMDALLAQAGLETNWTALMAQSKSVSYPDLAKILLSAAEPDDAANDYATLKSAVDALAAALSDQNFKEADGKRTASHAFTLDEVTATFKMTLDMDGESVKGYDMGVEMSTQVQGQSVKMSMDVALDDQNAMKATVSMDGAGVLTMEMNMEGAYVPGTTAPVVTPPEGASVISFTELMGGSAGVIGGADGPTAILAA